VSDLNEPKEWRLDETTLPRRQRLLACVDAGGHTLRDHVAIPRGGGSFTGRRGLRVLPQT
jgi:hypothetical protein